MELQGRVLVSLLGVAAFTVAGCTSEKPAQVPSQGEPPAQRASHEPPAAPPARHAKAMQVRNVSVQAERSCAPVGKAGAPSPWLQRADIQRDVYALERALADYGRFLVGTAVDAEHQRVLVVFHDDFTGYDTVAPQIAARVTAASVVLAPACHSRSHIAEAQAVLEARAWHPKAKSVAMGFSLDPAIAGFDVTIDSGAPEVARALEAKLGDRVRVSLGKVTRT